MEPILPGAPWLIAHKSMLGINKPNKITLNGNDYVIWQNQKGEVFLIMSVRICKHPYQMAGFVKKEILLLVLFMHSNLTEKVNSIKKVNRTFNQLPNH